MNRLTAKLFMTTSQLFRSCALALPAILLATTASATRPELTYTVQTSADLQHWTTEGVTISDLGPEGIRSAAVPLDMPQRFLRLVEQ